MDIFSLKNSVISGHQITKEEAEFLVSSPLVPLCEAADEIRKHFCQNSFDLCTIVNGKSGRCSENCKYCAQSSFYSTKVEEYPLLSTKELLAGAVENENSGMLRYSIVTSGKRLSDEEIDQICESIRILKKSTHISLCASFGLLDEAAFRKLKEAGISRIHNNLETSRRNFENICTTHTFDDKIASIQAAKRAGLAVCSGGIMGLGETMDDRIDMAFSLRELGILSVPINLLSPIAGTPYEHSPILSNNELCRIVAIFRFILPSASIRLAGGRGLLEDKGERCFCSGANAAISGDMLTTSGISAKTDLLLLEKLGYNAVRCHE